MRTYRISYIDRYFPKELMWLDYKARSKKEAIRQWQSECCGCRIVSVLVL